MPRLYLHTKPIHIIRAKITLDLTVPSKGKASNIHTNIHTHTNLILGVGEEAPRISEVVPICVYMKQPPCIIATKWGKTWMSLCSGQQTRQLTVMSDV